MTNGYKANKTWRKAHPDKWSAARRRHYEKHRAPQENRTSARRRWEPCEVMLITDPHRPVDTVLAKKLGRSLKAIHNKRSLLKKSLSA